MSTTQIHRETSLWSYPATFIKHTGIGAVLGYSVNFLNRQLIWPLCNTNTGELRDRLCLRAVSFFNSQTIAALNRPFVALKSSIVTAVEPFIPNIDVLPKNCLEFLTVSMEVLTSEAVKSRYSQQELTSFDQILKEFFLECCWSGNNFRTGSNLIAHSLAEELVVRVGIQKIALLSLAKFFPERIRKIVSLPTSRVLITSFIFAFLHLREDADGILLPQFLGSLVYGFIYEKYGFAAAATAHSVSNILTAKGAQSGCENRVALRLELLKNELK